MKTCCIDGCLSKLGNRNKNGYCQVHRHLSPSFKQMRSNVQMNFYKKLTDKEKKIRLERTQKCKDAKRNSEQLKQLNHIRSLSKEERNIFFLNKKKEYDKQYEKNRKKLDISFKIAKNLRSRLSKAISRNIKEGSAISNLGCTLDEFKVYLESMFTSGMSWGNYGEWHIDHIIPLCSFNLTDLNQIKEACHYKNLQPLWAKDNLSKISKDKEMKNGCK